MAVMLLEQLTPS